MQIRQEQIDTFRDLRDASFLSRQAARLRKAFPSELAGNDERSVEYLVKQTVQQAGYYGVFRIPDFELFLDCKFILGMYFDVDARMPWLRRILLRPDLSGTEKMSLIHDQLLYSR